MTAAALLNPAAIEAELAKRRAQFRKRFPEEGKYQRGHYPKHIEFFAAGVKFRERAALGGNRVGKTDLGGFEATAHLTGEYPAWWEGRRYSGPTRGWAAGDTSKTVRDIIQQKLLGEPGAIGKGMIPADKIIKVTPKSGIPDAVESIHVRHVSGGTSTIDLKSYDQRRESFQGTARDFVWLDEECPKDIYDECLMRIMPTGDFAGGCMWLTFTPLMGLTEVVLSFLPGGMLSPESTPTKFAVIIGWEDVPHLDAEAKAALLSSIQSYQRDARSKGIPTLGAGAIYPVPEEDVVVDDFPIPAHWKRGYGMDVGWNRTAAVWSAMDGDNDVLYLWAEHYRGEAEPLVHAAAIKARGDWMKGVIDPASKGRGQHDGTQLLNEYRKLGLHLQPADNAVDAGIYAVWTRLSTGRLKVFKSLSNWRNEYRLYRRDEKGKIVKEFDHLMDATRYEVMSGLGHLSLPAPVKAPPKPVYGLPGGPSWMA